MLNHYPGTLDGVKYAGSAPQPYPARKVSSGEVATARTPLRQARVRIPELEARGSFDTGVTALPDGMAFDASGKLWYSQRTPEYLVQVGTLGLRGGTDSRMGTVAIGSVASPGVSPRGLSVDQRGRLWHTDNSDDRIYQIGTEGLRGGTDSRMGTVLSGSVPTPDTDPTGLAFDARGHLWHVDRNAAGSFIYELGTLGLRGGTDSRIGTQLIGSVVSPARRPEDMDFDDRGRVWLGHTDADDLVFQLGTLGLRNGTDSRIGTQVWGSHGVADGVTGLAFDDRWQLWAAAPGGADVLMLGTLGDLRDKDILYPAPEHARAIELSVDVEPSSGQDSGIAITQEGFGTHGLVQAPAGNGDTGRNLGAIIDPTLGKYQVVNIGTPTRIVTWREWDLD